MKRSLSLMVAAAALGLLALIAPACGGTDEKLGDEQCDNGQDDDADGLTDCADPECSAADNCTDVGIEHCYNLIDDDNDGDVDCDDSECANTISCVETYESCASPGDEDGDGVADCEDPDCINTATCTIGAEACDNDVDDDGDGDVDCDDEDCANTSTCQAQPEDCENSEDDDGDGDVDCDDSDCANTATCVDGGEQCVGAVDEDGDGRIDCADPDCAYTRTCLGTLEICTNGLDDDGDGVADCADPDCEDALVCLERREDCTNRIDDDGDGDIDCADADCTSAPACTDEICDNGTDDDGDGQVDCQDFDCARTSDACDCDDLADVDSDDIPNCTDDDIDDDGIPNDDDNCPYVENADQADEDADDIGDVCEPDQDGDGIIDDNDNCPATFNPSQANQDEDEETADPNDDDPVEGDACEDNDADGWPDVDDNCPSTFNPDQASNLTPDTTGNVCASEYRLNFAQQFLSGSSVGEAIDSADFDGDGTSDLILGTPPTSTANVAWLLHGPLTPFEGNIISTPDTTRLAPSSNSSIQRFGQRVVGVGDVNGEGLDDYAVSAPSSGVGQEVFIYDGLSTIASTRDETDTLATIEASSEVASLGRHMDAPGDLDGDGAADLVISEVNTQSCELVVHLFSGAQFTGGTTLGVGDATLSLAIPQPCNASIQGDIAVGHSVIGDATNDIVVSVSALRLSTGGLDNSGHVFILDGANLPTGRVTDADVVLTGTNATSRAGQNLATDGDFDGDGIHDVIAVSDSGFGYIWRGTSNATLSGTPDVELVGSDSLGGAITAGLDVDGDGIDDLVTAGPGGTNWSYTMLRILPGRSLSGVSTIDVTTGTPIRRSNENIGSSLHSDLDITGDGQADLLIGGTSAYYLFPALPSVP